MDTHGAHSAEARVKVEGDGVELEGAVGHSKKLGMNAELDLRLQPNDALEIAARLEASEHKGVKGAAGIAYQPQKGVQIGGELEVGPEGQMSGMGKLKLEF